MENEEVIKASFCNNFKGWFFLATCIIIVEIAAIMIKALSNPDSDPYEKPLFLAYYSCCFFMIYLIPLSCHWGILRKRKSLELLEI